MEGIVMAAQLILGLSILVGLHELGHMLAAKMFGMRVEKFSIGFPPKVFSFTWGETEYSLGATPLGGFVKISGMVDESLDDEQLASEPKPYEFRSKPAWQRLIVMLGGIIMNVLTGMVIFGFLTYSQGETLLTMEEVNKDGVYVGELGEKIGLQTGDKILKVNDKDVVYFSDATDMNAILSEKCTYTVERDGKEMTLEVPSTFLDELSDRENQDKIFIQPLVQFHIKEVMPNSSASAAGLEAGDKILGVNSISTVYFHDLKSALSKFADKDVTLKVEREGEVLDLPAHVQPAGTLGFMPQLEINYERRDYSLGTAMVIGTERAFGIITSQVKAFSRMLKGDVSPQKSLSGPVGIAQMYGGIWDWMRFWTLTGMLSMVLAFMNLLPIPALDGGHVVFLLYEMISGRKPTDQFLGVAQRIGMVILLTLMVFVFGNDIYNLIVSFIGK
ncbi:RIP metalloprotease RseP [Sediminitomix flava]|uniref:Zinc metalloprotease n=1 Tax=Sediminitomix flava TaxID=379075 RepID=A0A315Z6W2_SEDFL|nr:RIP metalloprotease RseP [Sediminitomix flava]PWJ39271.1 site-2 protease [Sediminitomix flava]